MAKQVINNLESAALVRSKLNDNFTELYGLTEQAAPTNNKFSGLTTPGAVPNSHLVHVANVVGVAGDAITIEYSTAADDVLAVTVTGSAINVKKANTTASKNTATLIKALLNGTPAVKALITTFILGVETGAGVAVNFAATALSGYVLGTVGYYGQTIRDTNKIAWKCVEDQSGLYLWMPLTPNTYPALNIEYPTDQFDGVTGNRIWFSVVSSVLPNNTTTNLQHNLNVVKPIDIIAVQGTATLTQYSGNWNTNIFAIRTSWNTSIVSYAATGDLSTNTAFTKLFYTNTI